MAEEKTGLVQGFKEFVMRGNVIDLAVAVVVGGAFAALVKSFADNIINPVIAALGGADEIGLGFSVNGQFVNLGAVITALFTFVITMAVVYFVFVLPMNKARAMAKITPKAAETPADVVLLTEIRDLLANQAPTFRDADGTEAPGPR
jgi:large conductance mechanosensitive channel